MRVFFAIEFEENIKEYLFNLQDEIRQNCLAGNFTFKNNFHLTLRFMGEQTHSQTEQLIEILKKTATNMKAFELILDKLGKFDKGNRKIIWVGLKHSIELDALFGQLESNLVKQGYQKEARGFSPHITLAREVRIDNFEANTNKTIVDSLAFRVKTISLMESKRVDNKLCYVPLSQAELTNN